jgi:hypothetical protein
MPYRPGEAASPAPGISRRKRRALAVAVAFAAGELLYLLAANLLLASPSFQHALDPVRPGTRIRYESAWSPVPGVLRVRGFDYLRDGPTRQWSLHIDRAWALFDPTRLPFRTVRFLEVGAEGVALRLRKRPAEPRDLAREALLPPIEGMKLEPLTRQGPRKRAWRVRIDELEVEGLREVWLDTLRWQGRGQVSGGFTSRARESATIFPSRIEMESFTLAAGPRVLAWNLAGRFEGRSANFQLPVPAEGLAWLEAFTIAGTATAEGVDGSSLDPYLPATSPMHLSGGAGPIAATLALVDGTLETGSRLDWSPERLGVSFLGYSATGSGELRAEVTEGLASEGSVRVALDRFEVSRDGGPRAYLEGDDLSVHLAVSDRHLDGRLEGGFRASAAIDQARIPDLRVYDSYLPARLGLQVTAGAGDVSARFELVADGTGQGRVEVTTHEAQLRWDDLILRGQLRLDACLATRGPGIRQLALAGTTLRLDGVSIAPFGEPELMSGWWAAIDLPRGEVRPGSPEFVDVVAHARLRDAGPLEAIFGQRHPILARLAGRIDSKGVTADAALRLAKDRIQLDVLRVVYPEGTLDARFEIVPESRRGELLARWRRWAVGLAFRDGQRDWVLRGAEQWWASTADGRPDTAPQ